LQKVNIVSASDINTYKIMDCSEIVFTESSIAAIGNLFNA